jgi:23S rRNA pseudouridine2605 synthase
LNRFLALCGCGSRRKCELFIQAGRVAIDGNIVRSLSTSIDEMASAVTVDGKRVAPPEKFIYILMNKPKGYVTTASDELGRKTVIDLLPDNLRVFPVGRLDKDTMGALLFTNDGAIAFRLLHPKFDVDKIYHVSLDRSITNAHVQKLQAGIVLEEGITSPCQVKIIQPDRKEIEVIIHEGRKRQIRRMLKSLGYEVVNLVRTKFATMAIANLKPGEWRYLTDQEIRKLKTVVLVPKQ